MNYCKLSESKGKIERGCSPCYIASYLQRSPSRAYTEHCHVSFFSVLQEPVRSLGPRILSSDMLNLLLTLPLPGISLLHVCAKTVSPPPKVSLM